jgi:arylsulfatase A-like enzyme
MMNGRDVTRMAALGVLCSLCCSLALGQPTTRPNILWMFADDHAYQAIGAYGGRFENENLTPHIDTLARDGMLFRRSYVCNSICAPSRATLLTGKHSHLNGKYDNRGGFNHDQPQFQKVLRENGYQTAMIGKIHLNGKMQGFDYWEVLPGQGRYWDPIFVTEKGKTTYPKRHSTDVITERSLNWLKSGRDRTKPFMLMVHFKAPHRNWQPKTKWKEAYKHRNFPEPDSLFDDYEGRGTAARMQDMSIAKTMSMNSDVKSQQPERKAELSKIDKNDRKALTRLKYQWYMRDYLACIAGVDESVGVILDYLKESGLEDNTVVMYSADQGFYLGEHGWFDKRFMYKESFRTPLLVRWPGVVQPGSQNTDLVQNIDWAETFLDLAGAPIPHDMQGKSLVPLLKGQPPADWRTSLYYHYYEYPAVHSVRRHEGVATKRYKLIRFYGKGVPDGEEWELYDLETDPNEMRSIYADPAQRERIAELKQELQRLRAHYRVPNDSPQQQQQQQQRRRRKR